MKLFELLIGVLAKVIGFVGFVVALLFAVQSLLNKDWAQAAAWLLLLCWGELARMNARAKE